VHLAAALQRTDALARRAGHVAIKIRGPLLELGEVFHAFQRTLRSEQALYADHRGATACRCDGGGRWPDVTDRVWRIRVSRCDCHATGTHAATHTVGDIRPNDHRHRIDTPSLRGVGIQRLFGSQRALKSVEDFTEFEQRAALF